MLTPPADPAAKLRVLLADDHAIVREGLRLLIDSQPDMIVVDEAENGRAAINKAEQHRPDVIVLDVEMPVVSGPMAAQHIKQTLPGAKILALSFLPDTTHLHEMLRAGAAGYVLKLSDADELLRAIRTVARGGVYLDPGFGVGVIKDLLAPSPSSVHYRDVVLTEREEDVMRRIARGYSNHEIAAQLEVSVKTVETYKLRSMEKLRLNSRVDVMRYAMRQGWFDEKDDRAID